MTEDPRDEEYLDLFKPKVGPSAESASQVPGPGDGEDVTDTSPADTEEWRPVEPLDRPDAGGREFVQPTEEEPPPVWEEPIVGQDKVEEDYVRTASGFEPPVAARGDTDPTLRTLGMIAGGGCLLIVLTAVVVFAFYQVFVRRGGDDEPRDTPTPTQLVAVTPSPTVALAEPPVLVPVVSSSDVRVPVAFPERLTISETVFTVQAVQASAGTWPAVPTTGDTVNWSYGTVVNYVFGMAPTIENVEMLAALQVDARLSLHMSTGVILNFNVDEITTGSTGGASFFDQTSPRLTLALLTDDPSQRTVVTASFFEDEVGEVELFSGAAIGLVGTPVDQGPMRVTILEIYQANAGEAGLPPGTGYLLVDLRVENVGTTVLEPEVFQTFVSDEAGERYPLTLLAEQFAHYGVPTEPLAPGETVIGSLGYLVAGNPEGQLRWGFNPLPGSDYWVIVPMAYDSPPAAPTSEPPPAVGFARVTVDTDDVFVDRDDGLLDIGLRIENISEGVVQVTEEGVSLSSWTDGELPLVAAAPLLPWTVEPGDLQLFQLQFELPTADTALLSVLDYTFSIENLGGQ
jgi:hypothetical protein